MSEDGPFDHELPADLIDVLDRIAQAPDEPLTVLRASGITAEGLFELLRELGSDHRHQLLDLLIRGASPHAVACERAYFRDDAHGVEVAVVSLISAARGILDSSAKALSDEERLHLLHYLDGMLHSYAMLRLHFGMAVLRAASLPPMTEADRSHFASAIDTAERELQPLQNQITRERNRLTRGASRLILLEPGVSFGQDVDGLATLLRTQVPANDVEVFRPVLHGYGVTFHQVLTVWLPTTDTADPSAAATIKSVIDWMQARHVRDDRRPKSVTFVGIDGVPVAQVAWSPGNPEPDHRSVATDLARLRPTQT